MTDGRLVLGRAEDVLPTLPAGTFDAVITDPPYPEIDRPYGRLTEAEWFALMKPVVRECRRVLKPSGSAVFVLQPNSRKVGSMRPWLWQFMAWVCEEWNMVQDAYWWNTTTAPSKHVDRTVGLLRPSLKVCVWCGPVDCYRRQEAVLWEESQRNAMMRASRRAANYRPYGGIMNDVRSGNAAAERGGVTPFNVLPLPAGGNQNANGHTACTPLSLADWWVRYLCPPGASVLDPFAGSGTVGLAALKHGCSFVGVEKESAYVAIAEGRLAELAKANPLFNGVA